MAPGAVFRGWLDALFSRDRRENAKVYIKPLDLSGSLGLVFRMDKRTLPPILRSQTVPPSQPSTRLWSTPGLFAVLLGSSILTTACVSGGGPPSSMVVAPESVWQSLRRPRPQPLATAPRISVGEVILVGGAWPEESAVSHTIGLQELVAATGRSVRGTEEVLRRRGARGPRVAPTAQLASPGGLARRPAPTSGKLDPVWRLGDPGPETHRCGDERHRGSVEDDDPAGSRPDCCGPHHRGFHDLCPPGVGAGASLDRPAGERQHRSLTHRVHSLWHIHPSGRRVPPRGGGRGQVRLGDGTSRLSAGH